MKIINCITPGTSLCNILFKFLAVAPILRDDIYLDRLSASELCVNWHSPINRGEYILLHYEVTLSGFPLRTIANYMRTCYDRLISGISYSFNLTVVTACRRAATRIYEIELGESIVPTSESPTVSTSTSAPTVSTSTSAPTVSTSTSAPTVSTSTSAPTVSTSTSAPTVSTSAPTVSTSAPTVSTSVSTSELTTVSISTSESTVSTSTSKFFRYILVKKAC